MSPAETLPAAILTTVVSAQELTLNALGRAAVLVFHGQDTAAEAMAVNKTVRAVYPNPDEVLIASIIDLRPFPSMFHGMVQPELEKVYHKAVAKLPDDVDAAALVVLLPDWKGAAHEACGVRNSTGEAVVVVADAQGRVLATAQGTDLGAAALAALADR